MSEKTESEVLSLAESDDSDSEEVINVISEFFCFIIFRSIFQFRLRFVVFKISSGFEYFEPRLARLRLTLEVFEFMLFITYIKYI